ncbi:hypothetical protein TNCV_4130801 [Trichonephila clavipes]|nr:hypothetical protein TNCV_4130801 [Trichonephila clavipes]
MRIYITVWCQKGDFMPITRAMDEQLKTLLEGINALKNGQEETRQEMQKCLEETRQEMQKGLKETRQEMQKRQEEMQKGVEDMQKRQEETKNELKERKDKRRPRKIAIDEEKIDRIKEQVEERIKEQVEERTEGVAENFSIISQRVENLEKKILASGNTTNETKFVTASPVHVSSSAVPLTASPLSVLLPTYDEKTTGWYTRLNSQ